MLYVKSKTPKSNRFISGVALAMMLISSIQFNPKPTINRDEAVFFKIFKLEIFGVLDGIKLNTNVDLYLFGFKIF